MVFPGDLEMQDPYPEGYCFEFNRFKHRAADASATRFFYYVELVHEGVAAAEFDGVAEAQGDISYGIALHFNQPDSTRRGVFG